MIEQTSNYSGEGSSWWKNAASEVMGFFNPRWRLEQEAADLVTEELNSFRNARHTRVSGRRIPNEGRADFHLEVGYDRRELVDRARQLERNSVIAEALLTRATENVVGPGYGLQMHSKNEAWNKDVEKRWAEWCRTGSDVRGMNTFEELTALTYRSWLRDGDVAAIKLSDGHLQMIESDQIANPMGNIPQKDHIDGIQLDERGRPVSYLIVTDPDPMWASVRFGQDFSTVPAKDVLFLARRQRHGQTRGLSAFANCSWLIDQIDGTLEATTIGARMAACVGLVIARQNRMSGLTTTTDSQGYTRRGLNLEPGMIAEIGQGDSVSMINPHQPSQSFDQHMRTLGRLTSLSFGLPLEVAFMDFTGSNYSNARAALLQAKKTWRNHQRMMAAFCSDVFRWWMLREIKAGRIAARRDALEHTWMCPGWGWIDPDKEIKANLAAIDAGLDNHERVCAEQGMSFEENVRKLAEENKLKEELGLPITRSPMTRDEMTAGSNDSSDGEAGNGGAFGDKKKPQ